MATKLAGRGALRRGRGRRADDAPVRAKRVLQLGAQRARVGLLHLGQPAARVATELGLPLPARWRQCPMAAEDVLVILDALTAAGVRHWVVGGWGVDALLGEETRRHDDLDLAIAGAPVQRRRREIDAARKALESFGYRFERDDIHLGAWFVERLRHRHRSGRRIDLLPIDSRPEDFFATGRIGGRKVPCLSLDAQLRMHTGYPRTAADRHDVNALCREFDLTAPRAERKMEPGWR